MDQVEGLIVATAGDLLQIEVRLLRFMVSPSFNSADADLQATLRALLQSVVDSREMAEEQLDG
jgi:hypothetical protein